MYGSIYCKATALRILEGGRGREGTRCLVNVCISQTHAVRAGGAYANLSTLQKA